MDAFMQQIWQRIIQHANSYEKFSFKDKDGFSYRVVGNAVYPDGAEHGIFKSQFEEVLRSLPSAGTVIQLDAPCHDFIYAILLDKRIRQKDW